MILEPKKIKSATGIRIGKGTRDQIANIHWIIETVRTARIMLTKDSGEDLSIQGMKIYYKAIINSGISTMITIILFIKKKNLRNMHMYGNSINIVEKDKKDRKTTCD